MTRAVVAGWVGLAVVLAACSGTGTATRPFGPPPACPLLAQLAATGERVARANVADPDAFDATLRSAVATYVRAARGLRVAVPVTLRPDVDRMITAAEQRHFSDAAGARNAIDDYAESTCKAT